MKKKQLKLYVWDNVLCDYTCGVMFALAESEDHARKMILIKNEGKNINGKEKEINFDDYKESSCTVWNDLKEKPDVYDSPEGFFCWGGG